MLLFFATIVNPSHGESIFRIAAFVEAIRIFHFHRIEIMITITRVTCR